MSALPENELILLKQLISGMDKPQNIRDLDGLLQQITWKIGWEFEGHKFLKDFAGKKKYFQQLTNKILTENPIIVKEIIKRSIIKRDWWWFNLRYSDIDKKYNLKPFK